MTRAGTIVRIVMIAACLVPFTNIRQVGAALAFKPTLPVQTAPTSEEDDSEREEQAGSRERAVQPRLDRNECDQRALFVFPPGSTLALFRLPGTLPVSSPLDHFHNGLGSPYRC